MVLSSWSNGSNSCRIPGGVMEWAKLCFCLGSGGGAAGPTGTGQGAAAAVKDTGTGCV